MRRASRPVVTAAAFLAASFLSISAAHAAEADCPAGSRSKTENGFSWCEPTVCSNDGQCNPNEVCRPMAFCLEVGTLADAGAVDGGKRLVVTQPCVAGSAPGNPKTCPQKQTCSDMSRCMSKSAAEKLGILTAPAAAPAGSAGAADGGAKKSSCGCHVVGARSRGEAWAALALVVGAFAARRRRRS